MKETAPKEVKSLEKQIKVLGDVSGRVVAPLVGLIAAGPVGAIAGGVVGTMIKYGVEEFLTRYLTPKEVRRVGTSAEYMITGIDERLSAGEEINLNFFEEKGGTSDAEEIFEGILLKTKSEYQEKKLRYLSNIFINASFDKTISADNVNQVLNIGDRLTYRQLCLISLIGKNLENKYVLRTVQKRDDFREIATEELLFLLNEAREMLRLGIINSKDRMSLNSYSDPAPADFCLEPFGHRLFQLMGLNEMSEKEYIFIEVLQN